MLSAIVGFELRYWLRGLMVWVFLLVIGLMIGTALSSDAIRFGGPMENVHKNAPFSILLFYGATGTLTLLMTTAFVNSAAGRDFACNTAQILFPTRLRKFDYLVGRYVGSIVVSILPMLGISLATLLVKYMPWTDADRWGPVRWDAHAMGILLFAIPDTIFIAAVIFAIAVLTRSTVATFLGGLLLLVFVSISDSLLQDLPNERWAILLDPFGGNAFGRITKYWTVHERNTLVLGFQGDLLLNRLIWISAGLGIFAFAYHRFSFAERASKRKKSIETASAPQALSPDLRLPTIKPSARPSRLTQFLGATRVEFLGIVKTNVFIVVLCAALLICGSVLAFGAGEGYGTSTYPVTYWITMLLIGSLGFFLIAITTYLAGMLVWKEREWRMDEIHDALPYPEWLSYGSKLTALIGAILIIHSVAILAGMAVQTWHGYHRYQTGLYVQDMLGMSSSGFVFLAVVAFLFQVLSPNKYVGYFAFVVFLIANSMIWPALNVSSLMVRFGSRPSTIYSDFFGRAPFWQGYLWFTAYWMLFAGLIAAAAILLWRRGKDLTLRERMSVARQRLSGPMKPAVAFIAVAFVASAGWVFYNTKILNHIEGPKDRERLSADYEKTYKKFENAPLPRVTAIKYNIDLYPETRNMVFRGEQTLVNKTAAPIDKLYMRADTDAHDQDIQVEGSKLVAADHRLGFFTYELSPAMQPGDSRVMRFTTKTRTAGFENAVSNVRLVQNGTFFDNSIAPQLGYSAGGELSNPNLRKKYNLPPRERMPALERNCTVNCANSYISSTSDWVSLETVISTSADQIAVAPGSLIKEWVHDGRRYSQYKFDRDSANFFAFVSARYKVAREDWNGVKIEVYYHPEHEWNVAKMVKAVRKALDYCSTNFGPYPHKQARILEFPRISSSAQAFPGSMPYSEGIGFIANLSKPDDIDKVHYVIAHEMAHQWWGHQVMGARMQGATLLSETLAQYSALMIMEKEYGRDMMHKFLGYEMDLYLRARGGEMLKERPMLMVESAQNYIHYNKGSVVMYYLKEMIGEDAINRALRSVLQKFAYAQPPYPTSHELVDALRRETPPDMQYLIKDLFEDITLFSNRTLTAKASKRADGKYDVIVEIEARKFKADEKGNETETKLDDWIEVGAFAKPAKGKKYGLPLHRERVRLTENRKRFEFVTNELPEKAGVDPYHLLIDRIQDDNMKKLSGS
jgi:ABC-2 type transport system permease protein